MNSIFIDCSLGLSGDMLLAALLDIGVPLDVINDPLELLGFENALCIKIEESKSFGLRGIRVFVEDKESNLNGILWRDIREIIINSGLNDSLKESSLNVFRVLAQAEASVHGQALEEVHFHEIGLAGTACCRSKILHMDLQTRPIHSESVFLQSYMYVDFRKIKTLGV